MSARAPDDLPEETAGEKHREAMEKTFGHKEFRHPQRAIVTMASSGRDILVRMPTGGGKSLCYQLPAVMVKKTTVVISPLRSLIDDQVAHLKSLKVRVQYLCGGMDPVKRQKVVDKLRRNRVRILYTTPEMLTESPMVKELLDEMYQQDCLERLVIDEAHCVSLWGNDFRESYRMLHLLRERYPSLPITALTATATKRVEADIVQALRLSDPVIYITSFLRPNIVLVVKKRPPRFDHVLAKLISNYGAASGIVYCNSRKRTEELSAKVSSINPTVRVAHYHAGMSKDDRRRIQREWSQGKTCLFATVAFGMGIDKADVRYVIHANMPSSIEAYYQEIGRAGRDGKPADALMFYSYQDKVIGHKMIGNNQASEEGFKEYQMDSLNRMLEFSENFVTCRHVLMCGILGEHTVKACGGACDNCTHPVESEPIDCTLQAVAVFNELLHGGVSRSKLIKKLGHTVDHLEQILTWLMVNRYLVAKVVSNASGFWSEELRMYKKAQPLMNGTEAITIPLPKFGRPDVSRQSEIQMDALQREFDAKMKLLRQSDPTEWGVKMRRFVSLIAINRSAMKRGIFAPGGSAGRPTQTRLASRQDMSAALAQPQNVQMLHLLTLCRRELSRKAKVAAYMICPNECLELLVVHRPVDKSQMSDLRGFGPSRVKLYGDVFLGVLGSIG